MRTSAWALLCSGSHNPHIVISRTRLCSHKLIRPSRRPFHSSLRSRALDEDGSIPPEVDIKPVSNGLVTNDLPLLRQQITYDGPDDGVDNGSEPSKPKDLGSYGSAARRARRNKPPREVHPPHIPNWFIERNVRLVEETVAKETDGLGVREDLDLGTSPDLRSAPAGEVEGEVNTQDEVDLRRKRSDGQTKGPYRPFRIGELETYETVYLEIASLIRAGLRLPTSHSAELVNNKPHIVLCCPQRGAIQFLREMIMGYWSLDRKAIDIVRLDAHDISEIGGSYLDETNRLQPNTISSLSYDVSPVVGQQTSKVREEQDEDEEVEDEEDDGADPGQNSDESAFPGRISQFSNKSGTVDIGMGIIPIGSIIGNVRDVFNSFGTSGETPANKGLVSSGQKDATDNIRDIKLGHLVESLITSRQTKASTQQASGSIFPGFSAERDSASRSQETGLEPAQGLSRELIILVEDYPQISMTVQGAKFLEKLHEVVDAKRRDGQGILIVGTASANEVLASHSKHGIKQAQAEPIAGPTRTVIVPVKERASHGLLHQEYTKRTRATNIRHLREMINRLAPVPDLVQSLAGDWDLGINREASFVVDLDDKVLSMENVDRIATLALGIKRLPEKMDSSHIERAMYIMYDSDQQKSTWLQERQESERRKKSTKAIEDADEKLRALRRKCNRHEKKLLNGVIDTANIKTTFSDVRTPPETIEALKTLTTLSLIRPDAFTYGVLANNRIPGLLLYGPPGTGKTLLAKAVAKESGATVLEISGSDVYDMYVGEGEKNVRAIFSLAKKLAPCVVFIDEADAILGSRGGSNNRNSHRELINQFLREWDGMTDFNAFIMVATNRPFDLDEASLRRMPRRLLVDLPTEKDREEILRIHLKSEQLDSEVSLTKLASDTPYYSGSDLKNLCVAAALACVREELEAAADSSSSETNGAGEEERKPPLEKRTLAPRHFVKATEEISASISEDMRSLSAIRKFDEKYGDRRGKRKKLGGYGFKTSGDDEKARSDAARVRNQ